MCSAELRSYLLEFFREKAADIVETDDWKTAMDSGSYGDLLTKLVACAVRK